MREALRAARDEPGPASPRRRGRRTAAAAAAVLAVLAGCEGSTGRGGPPAAGPSTTAAGAPASDAGVFGRIPAIVAEVQPSVVAIITDRGEGSGVVWGADGIIVTNHHVTASATRIEVGFADGQRSPARLVAADPITDLAVLRTDRRDLPAASFSRSLPTVGEMAIAVGNPLGFENTVTAGIVSGLHRSIPGSAASTQSLVDLVQTDAPISPGSSGGALLDGDGEVIGINVAYIPPEARAVSIGFAIPAPTVVDIVGQLLEDGTASHAFFGMRPAPLTPQIARRLGVRTDRGVVVLSVVDGGPAAAGGIRPGDVITSFDGRQVESVEAFLAALRGKEPGHQVTVAIVRGDQQVETTVTLSDRPS